ncbi:ABC transporter permease [Paractinoplanes lichenicola]|uniref:ABC transporter permease n=1 Tax=Paractinoplanes lichenicola TaxID=2802976 RepID=A0ABS1W040_9ACTN|nr:ABC transporter permease [Actinoplanes lichenicola]MBL7260067.1 ABC transporter permease [Actinoplanes lichenicola]
MTDLATRPAEVSALRRIDWPTMIRRYGAAAVLALLVIFNIIFTENFLDLRNILFVQLRQAAPTAIVALGMALVIATGGIDLSVGAVVALSGQVTAVFLLDGVPPLVALPIGILVGLAAGLFNGTLVSRFGIQPMIATLVLFTAGRGLAQVVTGGRIQTVNEPIVEFLGLGVIAGLPISVFSLIVITIAIIGVTRFTPAGTKLLAVGGNERAAGLVGIRTKWVKTMAYVVAGGLAGYVGLLELGRIQASDATNAGLNMELDAIAAVAVAGTTLAGGTFSPGRTIIGVLMLRLLQNTLVAHGIPREVAQIAQGLIIVAAIYLLRRSRDAR